MFGKDLTGCAVSSFCLEVIRSIGRAVRSVFQVVCLKDGRHTANYQWLTEGAQHESMDIKCIARLFVAFCLCPLLITLPPLPPLSLTLIFRHLAHIWTKPSTTNLPSPALILPLYSLRPPHLCFITADGKWDVWQCFSLLIQSMFCSSNLFEGGENHERERNWGSPMSHHVQDRIISIILCHCHCSLLPGHLHILANVNL